MKLLVSDAKRSSCSCELWRCKHLLYSNALINVPRFQSCYKLLVLKLQQQLTRIMPNQILLWE